MYKEPENPDELNKYLKKLDSLRKKEDWSILQLAKQSKVSSDTTIRSMYARNSIPRVDTLEHICINAFGISLMEFSAPLAEPLPDWYPRSDEEKKIAATILDEYRRDPSGTMERLMAYVKGAQRDKYIESKNE